MLDEGVTTERCQVPLQGAGTHEAAYSVNQCVCLSTYYVAHPGQVRICPPGITF